MLSTIDVDGDDCIADRLVGNFGSLREVVASPATAIERVAEDPRVAKLLSAVRRAMLWSLFSEARERPCIKSLEDLIPLLRASIGEETCETLLLFMLDTKRRLIRSEIVSRGDVDEVSFCVRGIIARCLDAGAQSLIIAHNHPSGDTEPSRADKDATRYLSVAARSTGLWLLDHVIVSRTGFYSFHANRLL